MTNDLAKLIDKTVVPNDQIVEGYMTVPKYYLKKHIADFAWSVYQLALKDIKKNMENVRTALGKARADMEEWLYPFGLSLEIDTTWENPTDNKMRLGTYKSGSVFEKTVRICIDLGASVLCCMEEPFSDRYSKVGGVVRTTVYHEVGHALVEQIEDWMLNFPESRAIFDDAFREKYAPVIDAINGRSDDQFLEEEDLVEDFAWNWLGGCDDPLRGCFEDLNARLSGEDG